MAGSGAIPALRPPPPWRAWAALLRAPNLPTVPGDPLAGALLAMADRGVSAPIPWAAAAAALALYAAGLVDNDLTGLSDDARERPERPLPSGAISRRAAAAARFALHAAGLAAAAAAGAHAFLIAAAIAVLASAYNRRLKRSRAAGPWTMGACRGLSLLMGAAAVAPGAWAGGRTLAGFAVLTAYVAFVTRRARDEASIPGRPASIGRLLGALPLLQAALVMASGRPAALALAPVLLLCAAFSAALRNRFAAS